MLATTQHFNTALLSSRGIQILRDSKASARDTTLLIPCASPYYNMVILWNIVKMLKRFGKASDTFALMPFYTTSADVL